MVELSYDHYYSKGYRVQGVSYGFLFKDGTVSLHLARVAPPVGAILQPDFSQIKAVDRTLLTILLWENK